MKILKIRSNNDHEAILNKLKKQPNFKRGLENLNKELDKKPVEKDKRYMSPFSVGEKKQHSDVSYDYKLNKILKSPILKEKLGVISP